MLTMKEGVGVYDLNDWKQEFLRIVDIRIDILLHIHIYTNSHLVAQWKHWKGKWKNYTVNMSLSCRQSSQ